MAIFCSAPFTQLYINPNGDVSICCELGLAFGNIKTHSLEEIWNGEELKNLRKQFTSGENTGPCFEKIKQKNCHHHYQSLKEYVQDNKETNYPIAYDCTLNTECSLDCIMCIVKQAESCPQMEEAFLSFTKDKGEIYHFSLKSGEPLAQERSIGLLLELALRNPACQFVVTTSGCFHLTKQARRVLQALPLRSLHFSLDSLNPTNYKTIRPGGDWQLLKENLAFFNQLKRSGQSKLGDVCINMTVQKANWFELFEIYEYCQNKDFSFSPIFVFEPEACSLQSFSEKEADEVLRQFCLWIKENPEIVSVLNDMALPLLPLVSAKVRAEFQFDKIAALEHKLAQSKLKQKSVDTIPCPLPFTHLEVFPQGDVQTCCWLENLKLGNLHSDGLEKIWHSPLMEKMRNEFICSGPTLCAEAMEKRHCHLGFDWKHFSLSKEAQLLSLGLNLGHECNLRCVMCGVIDQKHDEKFAQLDWAYENEIILKKLKRVILKGGEPFIQKRAYDFIEYLSSLNPTCRWSIYTNGNHVYEGRIAETIAKLNLEFISVSIDSMDPARFSKIRRGGDLNRVKMFSKNLAREILLRPMRGVISFAAQPQNIDDLEAVADFSAELGFDLDVIPVTFPKEFSLENIEASSLHSKVEDLRKISFKYKNAYTASLESALKQLLPSKH